MKVGELRQKLSIYDDDQTVMVQSPDEREIWTIFSALGEAEEGEIVVIITEPMPRASDSRGPE